MNRTEAGQPARREDRPLLPVEKAAESHPAADSATKNARHTPEGIINFQYSPRRGLQLNREQTHRLVDHLE